MEDLPQAVPAYPGSIGFFAAAYGDLGAMGEEYFFNMRRQSKPAR
jgi:hypothetical protein